MGPTFTISVRGTGLWSVKYRSADSHLASMSKLGKVALIPTICIGGNVSSPPENFERDG